MTDHTITRLLHGWRAGDDEALEVLTPLVYDQLKQLAKLPSKDVLITQLLAGFNSPITGFIGTLQGIIRKFFYAVDEIAKQKQENN